MSLFRLLVFLPLLLLLFAGPLVAQDAQPSAKSSFVEERVKGRSRLFVRPIPDDATVRILNIAKKFDQGLELGPGDYVVEVKKKGVGEVVRTVTINRGEDLTLTVDITPQAAEAATETPPATSTPAETSPPAEEVPAQEAVAAPPAAEPEQTSNDPGRLYVKTDPDQATVKLLGIDPKFKQGIKLPPGPYRIQVSKEGYQTTEIMADVYADKDTRVSITLVSDTPEPAAFPPAAVADGKTVSAPAGKQKERLYVVSIPADAQIRVLNIAPKFQQGIEVGSGKFEVEVSAEGYEVQVRMVEVPKGRHIAAGFDLRSPEQRAKAAQTDPEAVAQTETTPPLPSPDALAPDKGQLFVDVDVADAVITLPDLQQSFVQGLELPPGSYRIDVFKEGVGHKEAMGVVSAGRPSRVQVQLAPQPEPDSPRSDQDQLKDKRQQLFDQAQAARERKELDKALDLLTQAVQLDTSYAQSYMLRGDVYQALKDYDRAVADFDRAIELYPHTPQPYLARGKTFALLKDADSACFDYWKACAMDRCEGIIAARREGLCR